MVSSSFSPFHKPQQDLRVSVAQISDQRSCLRDRVWWELALVLLDVCHVLGWLKCLSLPFSNYYGMTKWTVPTFCSSSTMIVLLYEHWNTPDWLRRKTFHLEVGVCSNGLFYCSSTAHIHKITCIINYKIISVWLIVWIVKIRLDDLWWCFVCQQNLFAPFEQHKHICDTPFRLSRQWMCEDS